jgi:hypothetical protein
MEVTFRLLMLPGANPTNYDGRLYKRNDVSIVWGSLELLCLTFLATIKEPIHLSTWQP